MGLAVYASNRLSAEHIIYMYICTCPSCLQFFWEYVSSICFSLLFGDVSDSIGGRSGDLTYVGRVARVWVETKWD